MRDSKYYVLKGGAPDPSTLVTDRSVFKEAYAFIPRRASKDITASFFPFWEAARGWVLARPLSGFAETFSQIAMEVGPGGGSDRPEDDPEAEAVLFFMEGSGVLSFDGESHHMVPGSYAYLPPGLKWSFKNLGDAPVYFHWIRKRYQRVEGLDAPPPLITNESEITPIVMALSKGAWMTTRFVDPTDLRHDMHVNIVTFEAGGTIPFAETHVMEHGLYVLEGKAVYRLNDDWIEVEAGDFMWLRAFCPQACYEGGPERFSYLLYKDVNRQMPLKL